MIITHYDSKFTIEQKFYGGITKDILTNLCRHNIEIYLGCVKVNSYDTATRIEGLLCTDLGVYIGKRAENSAGNGGDDQSTIVYLSDRKAKGFQD